MATQGIQWAATANEREVQFINVIEELRAQVKELQAAVTQRTTTSRPRQVLPEPDRFDGYARDWDTWSMAMRAKLRIDGAAIGDEYAQLYYIYASLGKGVQALVLAFMKKAEARGKWDPSALLEYLERLYDDPNKAKKAGQRLRELQQGSTSLTAYLPRFERTLFEAGADDWPDDAKITTLVGGLNKDTKQRLNGQLDLPTQYNAFVRTLLTLGNQFGTQHMGMDKDKSSAMEWEQTKVAAAKVAPAASSEQRQRWRDEGKCVRCGSKDHWVSKCNYQPTRNRSSSASSRSTVHMGTTRTLEPAGLKAVRVARTKTTAVRTGSFDHTGSFESDSDPDSDAY